jgi:uncharacterized protein with HEPN domain
VRDYPAEAIKVSQGKTRADLENDRVLNLALVRLCELIGEAANRVPPELRQRYPQIPWRPAISFRNRLIHGYDSADLDIVWQVLTRDLPPLITEPDRILADIQC